MVKHYTDGLEYFTYLENPRVLFLSGMHGDEYESGILLEEYLRGQESALPTFVYIPKVSPSAVAKGGRKNALGNDINRQFYEGTRDPEAVSLMQVLKNYRFEIAIDLHEDPDRTQAFYLYDSHAMSGKELETFRQLVHQTGSRLYTGIDDIDDEHLRRHIDKGYISLPPEALPENSGFSSVWMMRKGIVQRAFTLEIPGRAKPELKRSLIGHMVPFLVTTAGV